MSGVPEQPRRWTRLPEPVDLDATITSADSIGVEPEGDEYWRELLWLMRTAGGV